MSKIIRNFRELNVYKRAFELQQQLFKISKDFPREEKYSLTDQLRRSSRSIGANIAEAWQKRRYPAHFISKLSDADGELAETEHWVDTAAACEYLDADIVKSIQSMSAVIGGMLGKMMKSPESWC
jgi:four helix bundle protein